MDEGLDGDELCEMLQKGGVSVIKYEALLRKNERTPDDYVLRAATKHNVVVVTTDGNMEVDSLDLIVDSKVRMIVLTANEGGIANFAAALICSHEACQRHLLSKPGPLVIHVNSNGALSVIRDKKQLLERQQKHNTAIVVRNKRRG